jgi:hypothetical protein
MSGTSGRLVRLPDPFRPSRSAPLAATPTCCCCCCCCVATLVTSSVVLPMRLELRARRGSPELSSRLRDSKIAVGVAPWLGLAVALGLAIALESLPVFVLVYIVGMYAALALTDRSPTRWRDASLPTLVFGVVFAVEFVVGAVLILATAGIGYLIVGVLIPWLVIRAFGRRLKPPLDSAAPPPPPAPAE